MYSGEGLPPLQQKRNSREGTRQVASLSVQLNFTGAYLRPGRHHFSLTIHNLTWKKHIQFKEC